MIFTVLSAMNSDLNTREQLAAQLELDFLIEDDFQRAYLLDFLWDTYRDPASRIRELLIFEGLGPCRKTTTARKIRSVLGSDRAKLVPMIPRARIKLQDTWTTPLIIVDDFDKLDPLRGSEPFMISMMEDFSSGARTYARDLYGELRTEVLQSNVIYVCDQTPADLSQRVQRKGRVIKFSLHRLREIRQTMHSKLVPSLLPNLADIVCSFYGPD